MTETRAEQIERLKGNEWVVYGALDQESKDILNNLKFTAIERRHIVFGVTSFLWRRTTSFIDTGIYRISPDYKEEPEAEKYLSFDIDWEYNNNRGGFNAYSRDYELTCTIDQKSFKDFNGNKYMFKFFEYDLPDGSLSCNINKCIMYKKEFKTITHVCKKSKMDQFKTIFANRIVFERCD